MRALGIIRRDLRNALGFMHAVRRRALWFAVLSVIRGGRLSLTCIGRSAPGSVAQKHCIKRIDRLMGNAHLHRELAAIYSGLASLVLRNNRRPLILVDWSAVGIDSMHHALVASVPLDGRSVVIFQEVHPEKTAMSSGVEKRFLLRLRDALPEGCQPIVVTDAGFRMPWFDTVRGLGWDYVGRLTATTKMRDIGREDGWFYVQDIHRYAAPEPCDLGEMEVRRNGPRRCRVVMLDQLKRTGRVRRTRRGKPSRAKRHRIVQQRARRPWVLATSLNDVECNEIVSIYKTRMQIEEGFRDVKSHRFGWSFEDARSSSPKRLAVLLLLAALAAMAVLLAGFTFETLGLHRRYQANTTRRRRVLSLFFLGKTAIASHDDKQVPSSIYRLGLRQLLEHTVGFANTGTA